MIGIIADTHYGVRSDNPHFLDANKKFVDETLLPKLRENGVTTLVHLGDLFDKRKHTNNYTANRLRLEYIEPILSAGIEYHQIVGNHDTYFKNKTSVNSIVDHYSGKFKIYDQPEIVTLEGEDVLILPWICEENAEKTMELIASTSAPLCFGHLELKGFQMYRGVINTHGLDGKIFESFDMTLSGHFHHRSIGNSISYLGSHAQFTWSDYGDSRGFHLFDTKKRDMTFIENPDEMFVKVFYDDQEEMDLDVPDCHNKCVKIVIINKTNPYMFDLFCNKIDEYGPIDVQIVEDHKNVVSLTDSESIGESPSTVQIFTNYLDDMNISGDTKEEIYSLFVDLFQEAINLQDA